MTFSWLGTELAVDEICSSGILEEVPSCPNVPRVSSLKFWLNAFVESGLSFLASLELDKVVILIAGSVETSPLLTEEVCETSVFPAT